MGTHTAGEVVRRTGCTYRQLDYWCRMGYVPGHGAGSGKGSRRSFTDDQVDHVARLVAASRHRVHLLADA